MKVELIEKENKKFKPINVHIMIETLEELIELVKRLNIASVDIDEADSYLNKFPIDKHRTGDLFDILDSKLIEYIGDQDD